MALGATEIALVGTTVTLIDTVWKASSLATQMTSAITELRASVAKIEIGLVQLAEIPLLKQRVELIESVVNRDVREKLQTVWLKVFSHDKHIAVVRERQISQHDIEPDEDDDT
jgi:hypothetical protein